MEDYEEAIRNSTGRQRRQLIEKRERTTTKYNLEQEHVDTERERQEELWAAQDERFEKQKEYQETLMELEEENFELTKTYQTEMHGLEQEDFERRKDEYQEQFALQEEMTAKQREHQAEMMELQEQSIGIQAAAAALQKEHAENMQKIAEDTDKPMKSIALDAKYGERILTLITSMLEESKGADPGTFTELGNVLETLDEVDISSTADSISKVVDTYSDANAGAVTANVTSAVRLLNVIMGLDPWKLQLLADALDRP
jgi:hypothetical protein